MRGKRNETKRIEDSPHYTIGFNFGQFYGRLEAAVERFAMESGGQISGPELAGALGELLLAKARREWVGPSNSLFSPELPREATEGSEAVEQVEVAGGPRGGGPRKKVKRHMSKQAIAAISFAQKQRWKKYKQAKRKAKIPIKLLCRHCGIVAHSRSEMTAHYNLTHRKYGKAKTKRKLNEAQLAAMRANIAKGRATRLANLKAA